MLLRPASTVLLQPASRAAVASLESLSATSTRSVGASPRANGSGPSLPVLDCIYGEPRAYPRISPPPTHLPPQPQTTNVGMDIPNL